jgi:hypothetical protein
LFVCSKTKTTAQIELRHTTFPLYCHDFACHEFGIVCIGAPQIGSMHCASACTLNADLIKSLFDIVAAVIKQVASRIAATAGAVGERDTARDVQTLMLGAPWSYDPLLSASQRSTAIKTIPNS